MYIYIYIIYSKVSLVVNPFKKHAPQIEPSPQVRVKVNNT